MAEFHFLGHSWTCQNNKQSTCMVLQRYIITDVLFFCYRVRSVTLFTICTTNARKPQRWFVVGRPEELATVIQKFSFVLPEEFFFYNLLNNSSFCSFRMAFWPCAVRVLICLFMYYLQGQNTVHAESVNMTCEYIVLILLSAHAYILLFVSVHIQ
jgi:hypothetical protein